MQIPARSYKQRRIIIITVFIHLTRGIAGLSNSVIRYFMYTARDVVSSANDNGQDRLRSEFTRLVFVKSIVDTVTGFVSEDLSATVINLLSGNRYR